MEQVDPYLINQNGAIIRKRDIEYAVQQMVQGLTPYFQSINQCLDSFATSVQQMLDDNPEVAALIAAHQTQDHDSPYSHFGRKHRRPWAPRL